MSPADLMNACSRCINATAIIIMFMKCINLQKPKHLRCTVGALLSQKETGLLYT